MDLRSFKVISQDVLKKSLVSGNIKNRFSVSVGNSQIFFWDKSEPLKVIRKVSFTVQVLQVVIFSRSIKYYTFYSFYVLRDELMNWGKVFVEEFDE